MQITMDSINDRIVEPTPRQGHNKRHSSVAEEVTFRGGGAGNKQY